MTPRPTTIERAFALAATGRFTTLSEIRRVLAKEHYPDVRPQLEGRTLQRQLYKIMAESNPKAVAAFRERNRGGRPSAKADGGIS